MIRRQGGGIRFATATASPAAATPRASARPAGAGAPTRRLVLAGLAVIVALAAVLRFVGLGHQGLWYDESVTGWLLRDPVGRVLHVLPRSESTPPLYYLVAWAWVRVFGNTPVGMRSLSALAGLVTVPVAFAAARSLTSSARIGLVAALLVAVNPLLVWYSQEARSYALLALTTAVTLWLLARARERPTTGRLVAWGAGAAVALATHYFAIFALLPQAALLLADRRAAWRRRLVPMAIVGATGVALLGLATTQAARKYWFLGLSLPNRFEQVVRQYMVGFTPPAGRAPAVIAGLVVIAALALLAWRASAAERRGAAVAAAVATGAVGIPILLAIAGKDYVNTRNVLAGLVPCAIVVATGLGARRAGIAGLAAAGVLVAVSLTMVVRMARDPLAQRGPWQHIAAALRPHTGHRAIIIDGSRTWARPITYYLPQTYWVPYRGAPVTEIDVLRRIPTRQDCNGMTWWGATCDLGARHPLKNPPVPGFHRVGIQRVHGFEIARYRSPRPIMVYPRLPAGRPADRGSSGHHQVLLTSERQVLPGG